MQALDQDENEFDFEDRSSIAITTNTTQQSQNGIRQINDAVQIQPAGDTRESEGDFSLLDEATMDNLTDHLNQLGIDNKEEQKQAQKHYGKRTVTADEQNELRNTTLVRMKKEQAAEKEASLNDYKFLMVIGRGTDGKVFLAEHKETKKLYAVKSIR